MVLERKTWFLADGTLDLCLKRHYLPSVSHVPHSVVTRLFISVLRWSESQMTGTISGASILPPPFLLLLLTRAEGL